jgi:Tfp pilus assembly protein PilO
MNLTDFTNKYKNIIFNIALVLGAVFIAYNFIYTRHLKDLTSLKQQKETEIKKNAVLEKVSKLEKRLNAYKNFLVKKDTGLIIGVLSNMARATGLEISSIRPETEQKFLTYIKVPFSLEMSADNYHALGEFISKLESSSDIYRVEEINIRSQGPGNKLAVNLKVNKISFK